MFVSVPDGIREIAGTIRNRNHPSNEDQNPREPLRGAQQKNGDRNPHHGEKPRRNNHQPRHSVPKTRNPQDDIDERDEVVGTMGAEIVKLRKALKEKEVDRASVSRGRTNNHGSKSRRSLTPVHSGRTKRHRSLNTIERVIKEFIPARSIGDSSYPRTHRAVSSKRQKTHVSSTRKMPTPPRKAGGDLWSVITQKRIERNRAKSDMTGGNHALDRLVLSPFSPEIKSLDPPKGFSLPKFTSYDGKGDPYSHISHFRQMMTLYSRNAALMCKGKKEPLRDFAGQYFDTYNEIEGCNEELAVASFKLALPLGNRLRDSLTKRAATSIKELMDRVEKHARIEEDNNRTDVDMVESSPKDNGQKEFKKVRNGGAKYGGGASQNQRERSNPREAINTLFKEPIYKILPKIRDEPYFAWPPKMPGDPTKRNSKWRCSYHKDYGHMTANCRALKQHLEELVTTGHLRDFIDEGAPATVTQPEQRRRGTNAQDAPRGVIDMIHGIVDPSFENELRGQLQKARHMPEVLRVEPPFKKASMSSESWWTREALAK
ncbi:hypothetical protein Vadar_003655 [Vaccinium darrowii]|uniref:Uncharacterized protein n=1 Tax=Vaccinium darrowii TaxID=229202 RepID=A0ACB7XY00_9ERIC|nr:hypothetical protein Vadar_003655 [Vaccinium darrowii]